MIWVYSIILGFSAGLCTYVFARVAGRLAVFSGTTVASQNVLGFAALSTLGFLMVAQTPPMALTAAALLWFAGMRHQRRPLSFFVQAGLIILTVILGLGALPSPHFNLPSQIPAAAIMFAVYVVWCGVMLLPLGAPSHALIASYAGSLAIFIVGVLVFGLPAVLAGDALVIVGALAGAAFSFTLANTHHGMAGQWVFLFLLGLMAASVTYAGYWWLGLLGIVPVCVYALVRKG